MDHSDLMGLEQPEGSQLKTSPKLSPSKGDESAFTSHADASLYDDDLMRELDKKHTELSTFLDEIPPSESSERDLMSTSIQKGDSGSNIVGSSAPSENVQPESSNFMGDEDLLGLDLSDTNNSAQKDTSSPKPDEIFLGKVNGKTEKNDGGDTALLQDLLDQANNIGGDISPDSLLTDDLLNLEKSPIKESKQQDQVVPPPVTATYASQNEEVSEGHKFFKSESPNLLEHDSLLDRSSISPMDLEEPKLPESPCFKPPNMATLEEESRFISASPELPHKREASQERPLIVDRGNFESVNTTKAESDIFSSQSDTTNVFEEKEYTRRETMPLDKEPYESNPNTVESEPKNVAAHFGGGDLPPSQNETPPPVPPHSWENKEKEVQPPPVPPHSVTSDFYSDEMQAPKFYESEDSSKTDPPADEGEKAQTEHDRTLELHDFEETIPESLEESVTPASDSGSSKIEVIEVKPAVKADPAPVVTDVGLKMEVQSETKVPSHQTKEKSKSTDTFVLSEEMQLLLNTFIPSTWFDPSKLHPTVSELVYWRDPKKSGAVFGSILVVLLALTLMSLISVVAYTSLLVLSGTFAFRVYKSVLQAVQKTQDGHPFKEYLDLDISIPTDKAQEISNAIINYANTAITQLRRLFLVEDLVDSAKFGMVLYLLTYIGGWFNGLTLIILGFIALFALPKVYETNKTVIDQYLELINSKISEVSAKVTTAVPFLKKEKAQ